MNRAYLLGALAILVGCGEADRPPSLAAPHAGGATGTGGKTNKGGAAGTAGRTGTAGNSAKAGTAGTAGRSSGGFGGASAGAAGTAGNGSVVISAVAPIVTITGPNATDDPNDIGNVLTNHIVDVTCVARAADVPGATVNVASTKVRIEPGGGAKPIDPIKETLNETGVTAQFALDAILSGPIVFICTAEDRSSEAVKGVSAPLNTIIDHGPTITISAPVNGTQKALRDTCKVSFAIQPTSLGGTDKYSTVSDSKVLLTIGDRAVDAPPLTGSAPTPSPVDMREYSGSVAFKDFPIGDIPNGPTIIKVVATNERGATAESSISVNVDGTPPTINWLKPLKNSIVGSDVVLEFEVIDPPSIGVSTIPGSGVDEKSIQVTLNHIPYPIAAKPDNFTHVSGTKLYTFSFSQTDVSSSVTQATIDITASDAVANAAVSAESGVLYLDDIPPLIDLDPPTIRERYSSGADTYLCSSAFDPLGEAANDGSISYGTDYFRVLAWDRTNEPPPPVSTLYFSGTDKTTVTLWIQSDLNEPLLKDTDGDGVCDSISEGTSDSAATFIRLNPVTPAGTSPRVVNLTTPVGGGTPVPSLVDDTRFWPAPEFDRCTVPPTNTALPERLCSKTSEMYRVIYHSAISNDGSIPVIYGNDPPTVGVECTGRYWEYSSLIRRTNKEGWVCMAATAKDMAKNVGISPVHRVCFDDLSTVDVPACAKTVASDNQAMPPSWVPSDTTHPPRSGEFPARCPCRVDETYCIPDTTNTNAEEMGVCLPAKTNCPIGTVVSTRCLPCTPLKYKNGCATLCADNSTDPTCIVETPSQNCGCQRPCSRYDAPGANCVTIKPNPCALGCRPPTNPNPIRSVTIR